MGAYAYKEVLKVLPESYTGEGFKARHFGEEYQGDAGYDGDVHIAASDYIEDARELLLWLLESPHNRLCDVPDKMAKAIALIAPSGW